MITISPSKVQITELEKRSYQKLFSALLIATSEALLERTDELDQIKSTYRLQRNENDEPAHIPSRYDIMVKMGGLYEEDRNEEGYFEVQGLNLSKLYMNKPD